MTKKIGNVVIIEPEKPRVCDRCKKEKECRDVFGNGSSLCFECATPLEKEIYSQRTFLGKESS